MSGGQAVADCVATALGVPCIGRELVVEAAAMIGVSAEMLSAKLETSPALWDRFSSERGLYVAAVQAALADFTLACRVRLAFATRPASRGLDLTVKAENGVVTVRGDVPQAACLASTSTRLEHELRTIAAAVDGVQGVELGVRPFDPRG